MGFEQYQECMFCYLSGSGHHIVHDKCGGCERPCALKGKSPTICLLCISSVKGSERVLQRLTRHPKSLDVCYICCSKAKCYPILCCMDHYRDILGFFEHDGDSTCLRPALPESDLYPSASSLSDSLVASSSSCSPSASSPANE